MYYMVTMDHHSGILVLADDVIQLQLGDIGGDGYPNIAAITFGFRCNV